MAADAALLVLALGTIFLAGCGAVRWLADGAGIAWSERLALKWLLGAGFVSVGLFVFGLVFRGLALVAAVTAGAVVLFVIGRRKRPIHSPWHPLSRVEWLLVTVLFAQLIFLAWWAPQIALGWDGLSIWEAKARFAFLSGGALPASYFHGVSWVASQPRYPLMLPGIMTWLDLWLGRADESWARLPGVLFYVSAAGLLIGATPRLGGTRAAGLALAVAMFFVPYHFAGTWGVLAGYADFPLGVLWLAAVGWMLAMPDEPAAARFAAVLGALLVWVKREGVFHFGTLAVVAAILLWRTQRRRLPLVIAPGLVLAAGFAIFLHVVRALPDPNYLPLTAATITARAGRLPEIASWMAGEIVNLESWSLLWIGALIAIVVLFFRRRPHSLVLAAALACPLPGYALAFMLSDWSDLPTALDLALPRLLLQLAPAALLAIALAVPSAFSLATSADTKEDHQP